MEIVLVIVGAVAGLALGVWAGLKWGVQLSEGSSWRYWVANGVFVIAAISIATIGQMLGQWWLAAAGFGVMAGGITGLKYGYGHSVGIWAVHDRIVGAEKRPPDDSA